MQENFLPAGQDTCSICKLVPKIVSGNVNLHNFARNSGVGGAEPVCKIISGNASSECSSQQVEELVCAENTDS